jgi:hypothetical protein
MRDSVSSPWSFSLPHGLVPAARYLLFFLIETAVPLPKYSWMGRVPN